MTVTASKIPRFDYIAPWLLIFVVVVIEASSAVPIVLAGCVIALAAVRAARIGATVNGDEVVVRNF